jgi:hypothetical protein
MMQGLSSARARLADDPVVLSSATDRFLGEGSGPLLPARLLGVLLRGVCAAESAEPRLDIMSMSSMLLKTVDAEGKYKTSKAQDLSLIKNGYG